MVYVVGSGLRPICVVYYHVVYAIGSETVRPTYVVYYHVVYVIDSELLDPHM